MEPRDTSGNRRENQESIGIKNRYFATNITVSNISTPGTDDLYDLYDLCDMYDLFPLQFMI